MERTVLISLPLDELQTVIIDCVNSCLKYNKHAVAESPDKRLTAVQTAQKLGITIPTLYSKHSKGEIPKGHKAPNGKKLFWDADEIEKFIESGQVNFDASEYLLKNGNQKKGER